VRGGNSRDGSEVGSASVASLHGVKKLRNAAEAGTNDCFVKYRIQTYSDVSLRFGWKSCNDAGDYIQVARTRNAIKKAGTAPDECFNDGPSGDGKFRSLS
jgi:hypothetical protein